MIDIILTNDAVNYLSSKLQSEIAENSDIDCCVYISVIYPFTKYAHVNITFCDKNDLAEDDVRCDLFRIDIYLEKKSVDLLSKAIIDFKNDSLLINAPSIFNEHNKDSSDLKNSIKNLFENEINVILSQHGGFIELVDLSDDSLIVKFHGGCQGCGMIGYTLNNYIEKMIKKNFPQITTIKDVTSHEIKKNAYY